MPVNISDRGRRKSFVGHEELFQQHSPAERESEDQEGLLHQPAPQYMPPIDLSFLEGQDDDFPKGASSPVIMEGWIPVSPSPVQLLESKVNEPANQSLTTEEEALRQFHLMYTGSIQTPVLEAPKPSYTYKEPKHGIPNNVTQGSELLTYERELELRYSGSDNISGLYATVPLHRVKAGLPVQRFPNVTSLEQLPNSLLKKNKEIFPRRCVIGALSQVLESNNIMIEKSLNRQKDWDKKTGFTTDEIKDFLSCFFDGESVNDLCEKTIDLVKRPPLHQKNSMLIRLSELEGYSKLETDENGYIQVPAAYIVERSSLRESKYRPIIHASELKEHDPYNSNFRDRVQSSSNTWQR